MPKKIFVTFGDSLWRTFDLVLINVAPQNHLASLSTSRLTIGADVPDSSLDFFFIFLFMCRVFLSANVFSKENKLSKFMAINLVSFNLYITLVLI